MASRVVAEAQLSLLSWNVRGLNNTCKCKQVTHYLQRHQIDVAFLKEIHLRVQSKSTVARGWGEHQYFAGYSSYARGVAVFIHKRVPFREEEVYRDPEGRFVMVKGCMLEHTVLFVNIYAPNIDDSEFFNTVYSHMLRLEADSIYLGGDLNLLLDPEMDSTTHGATNKPHARQAMLDIITQFDLIDAWRHQYARKAGYTHYSAPHDTWTHLDYWCLSAGTAPWLEAVQHLPRTLSDHSPVLIQMPIPRAGGWRATADSQIWHCAIRRLQRNWVKPSLNISKSILDRWTLRPPSGRRLKPMQEGYVSLKCGDT